MPAKFHMSKGGKVYDLPHLTGVMQNTDEDLVTYESMIAYLVVENKKLSRRLSAAENKIDLLLYSVELNQLPQQYEEL